MDGVTGRECFAAGTAAAPSPRGKGSHHPFPRLLETVKTATSCGNQTPAVAAFVHPPWRPRRRAPVHGTKGVSPTTCCRNLPPAIPQQFVAHSLAFTRQHAHRQIHSAHGSVSANPVTDLDLFPVSRDPSLANPDGWPDRGGSEILGHIRDTP